MEPTATTADIDGWRIHRTGTSGGLILAVDFPISGRGEAGFGDLAPRLQTEHALWETLPETRTSGPISGRAELERWLPAVRESGLQVVSILSFCAGAAFLDAIVEQIASWQPDHTPNLIMFDPEVPAALTLYTQHVRALSRFQGIFDRDEIATFEREAYDGYVAADGDIEALIDFVAEHFSAVGLAGFERAGIDPKYGVGLTDAFVWFSRYLVAGAQLKSIPRWPHGVAITSRTTTNGLHRLTPELREGAVCEEVLVDVEHADLLSDAGVVAVTERLVPALRAAA